MDRVGWQRPPATDLNKEESAATLLAAMNPRRVLSRSNVDGTLREESRAKAPNQRQRLQSDCWDSRVCLKDRKQWRKIQKQPR
jgi:hypothetical protein